MRIALVSPGYPPASGGVEVVVAHTARALVRAGASVDVLAQERGHGFPAVIEDDGVVVRRFPAMLREPYPVAPGLWRQLRRHRARYDIVHGHNYHCVAAAGAALTLSTRRDGPRFVFSPHYHGGGHTTVSSLLHHVYRPFGRMAFARAAAVVCVSDAEADLVAAHFGRSVRKIAVVPNAVDGAAIAAAEPWPAQPPTVLSVGRLERYKRVDRLLEAFDLVPGPAQLVVIGDGADRERLEKAASGLDAGARIRFLGRVDDHVLARWLRTAGVLCSLSEHEAFGLAPAEAAAAGAALVLSDIPAHAELATRVHARLIEPGGGAAHIARALISALEPGPNKARAALTTWDDAAASLIGVYREALGRAPDAARAELSSTGAHP